MILRFRFLPVPKGYSSFQHINHLDIATNQMHVEEHAESFAIAEEVVLTKIFILRGVRVMLDRDLAELYQVETKQLKRAVRRNGDRFPEDFMFEVSRKEFESLRCQFGTSSWESVRYAPLAFSEQGVAMLSTVLSSEHAIRVNIQIIRIFTKMRALLSSQKKYFKNLRDAV